MPLIQIDFQTRLTADQKRTLTRRVRKTVNDALGSPDPYISVVIREWPPENVVESGKPPLD
jgi:4-oxalocrotonate tautomerase family enzyme